MTTTMSARPTATVPRAAAFTAHDASFARVLGAVPRLVRVVDVDAHEGSVYAPLEDALYVTSVPTDHGVAIRRIALAGERWGLSPERVSTLPASTTRANRMTAGPDGTLLVCEQGDLTHPARISRVETRTASTTAYVEHWKGRPLNSPNDLVLGRDGAVWFTDPSYGHLQGFRPHPAVGGFVYRLDGDGSLRVRCGSVRPMEEPPRVDQGDRCARADGTITNDVPATCCAGTRRRRSSRRRSPARRAYRRQRPRHRPESGRGGSPSC